MKAGATERIVVHIDFTKEVDEVIFTLKGNETLTKSFSNDNDGTFLIDLSQEETEKLEGMFQIEAQINFEDGSVKKTNIESKYINSTLATEEVIGSHATDDSLDMLLEVIKGDIALIISPESSNELIAAVSQLFLQTKAVADSVREDADSGKFDGEPGAKGDKGDKGDQGEQGIQGEKGDKGDKGDKGEQGVAGADGKDGKDGADGYTPIKGTDYFTPEEIAEIEEDVKESIGDDYVQKEAGKGLSSNDFTDSYKELLDFRITKQPDDIYAKLTQGRNISISAEGNNLSYQWQISDNQGASWTDSQATGYNTNTLSIIVGSRIYDGRLYRCKVTDGNGTILYSDTCQVIIDDSTRISNLETQLGGRSIVVIEESDYESLVTPDENTIYLITEDSV